MFWTILGFIYFYQVFIFILFVCESEGFISKNTANSLGLNYLTDYPYYFFTVFALITIALFVDMIRAEIKKDKNKK